MAVRLYPVRIRPIPPTPDPYNSTWGFIIVIQSREICYIRREETTLSVREMIPESIRLFITFIAMRRGTLERFAETRRGLRRGWWTGVDDPGSGDNGGLVNEKL